MQNLRYLSLSIYLLVTRKTKKFGAYISQRLMRKKLEGYLKFLVAEIYKPQIFNFLRIYNNNKHSSFKQAKYEYFVNIMSIFW